MLFETDCVILTSDSCTPAFHGIGVMAVMLTWVGGFPCTMWMSIIHLTFIDYEQGVRNFLLLYGWRPGFNFLQPFVSGKKGGSAANRIGEREVLNDTDLLGL
jgi:hypothetical protein